ncbi:hypothetical protein JW823_09185 [bacterium]|nr:hypothetical protein [candidate division CSSED10-310 bacterium]
MNGPKRSPLDTSRFRRKYIQRLIASPWTLLPFVAGVTDLLFLWALDINSGPAVFAGIAAILGSIGVFFTRMLTTQESLGRDVMLSLEKEALRIREKSLDDLDKRLATDGDPRTETCLRDLRTLARAFDHNPEWRNSLNQSSAMDVLSGVEQLFTQCVASLEKSLELWYTSRQMKTEQARAPIVEQRENIIRDVTQSIQDLGRLLADIQILDINRSTHESELKRIRSELNQSLEVAKSVKDRMNRLDEELDVNRIRE